MDVLISAAAIEKRIDELALAMKPALASDAILVGLLQGGFIFMADLMRALARHDCHPHTDFLWLSSYGDTRQSGRMKVQTDVQRSVEGRQVVLVDDVFDTGKTLAFAREAMLAKGAREVLTCVFARKPVALTLPAPDYMGFDVGDHYLVGYGLDDGGLYRGLPDLCAQN